MATAKKTAARRRPAKPPAVPPCEPCKGTGEVATPVCVGRGRRSTGHTQTGLCLTCFGTGEAPEA
jgi:hypothetical protein